MAFVCGFMFYDTLPYPKKIDKEISKWHKRSRCPLLA